jgi:hypothetical protein
MLRSINCEILFYQTRNLQKPCGHFASNDVYVCMYVYMYFVTD